MIACNNSLNRLAAAAEAKHLLVREQLMFQDPNSVQSKSYFDAMGQQYMSPLDQFSNQNSTMAAATPGSLSEEEVEDHQHNEIQLLSFTSEEESAAAGDNEECFVAAERGGRRSGNHVNYMAQLFCCAGSVDGCAAGATRTLELSPEFQPNSGTHTEHHDYNNNNLDQSFLPLPPTQSFKTLLEKSSNYGEEEGEDDTQLTTLSK